MEHSTNSLLAEYQKRFLFYKPYGKQEKFHNAGKAAIERLFLAGNRTGKTYCGSLEVAMHLTGNYPSWWNGHKFTHPITCWVASVNYETTRDILQKNLIGGYSQNGLLENGLIHHELIVKKSKMAGVNGAIDHAHIKHSSGGLSSIYFKSYKQGREKFQAQRCHVIHLDEEPPKDIYTECVIRLADVDGMGQGRMILTLTPLKGYTEMMAYYLQNEQSKEVIKNEPETIENGKYFIQASWADNPYLSEESISLYKATLKPHELEAREKGIPSIGSGLVYQIPESLFVTMPFEIPEHWHRCYGLDVGWNAPTAAAFIAIDRDNDTIYVCGEYSANERTPSQHSYYLKQMGADWMPGACDPAADNANQSSGESCFELYTEYKHGIQLDLTKSTSKKKEFVVTEVYDRIRDGKLKVFSTCQKFLAEWRMYSRDDKGKIMKGNDHLMNAFEYAILDGVNLARNRIQYRLHKENNYSRVRAF